MEGFNRIDVAEGKELEKDYDVDSMSYADMQIIHYDFVREVILDRKLIQGKNISDSLFFAAVEVNEKILLNLNGKVSDVDFRAEKIKNWKIQGLLLGEEKKFMKIILNGLSGREEFECAIKEESATASMFLAGEFYDSLSFGGEGLCKKHVDFVRRHPLMESYKR
ncbi:hypothetical protein [Pseudomonas sp. RIT-PI-AD]|uniref:hypothetical protein n=1 Tax=Pseudomonas sp. RIT-PI-AD TaxID=3035294 RepID=UPI0021D8E8FA|nr:hypothetical protein [Pseudomonas sp. RIT-PI-AD]